MTKAVITGGSVSFEKNRKIADYESEKASVTFNVGEGENAIEQVAAALAMARDYVFTALGLTGRKSFEEKVVTGEVSGTPEKAKVEKKTTAKKPPAPPADPTALDAPPATAAPAEVKQISTGEARVDPLELDPLTASPPTTTDAALTDLVTRKNAALIAADKAAGNDGTGGTKKIKDLIAKSGVTRVSELPQAARAQFLSSLEALK